MYSGCFECEVVLEGESVDDIVSRFLAHGDDNHEWSFPEEALRNYAANYAVATIRLTGSEERLPEVGEIKVHPVTDERLEDWLQFFDHTAFAGNPDWASCYCLEPHDPPTEEMPERLWSVNREMMSDRLSNGGAFGYLAYVDGVPAGWVNGSRISDTVLESLSVSEGIPGERVVAVACFVIAPPFRRHGVAGALLDQVIEDAAGRGASWIEGFPRNEPEPGDSGSFRGPLGLFESRGFEPVETRETHTVVRLRV